MKLPVDDFRKAFGVINLVGSHAGLLSSQFIKMVCSKGILKMSLTGLCLGESQITIPDTSASWTFYLDRRVLEAFLNTTRAQTLDLVLQKESLTLLAGKQKASSTPMNEVSGYSHWKPNGTLRSMKLSEQMHKELGVLSSYAPITAAADHLSAVYLIQKYGIIATDSFVVAACFDASLPSTFPLPVVISKLASDNKVSHLELDKTGAGIRFPEGYVYQTISSRCQTDYPIKAVQEVLRTSRSVPPVLKITAGHLFDSLEYLKKFIFGSDTDINIQCQAGQKEKTVLLTMDLIRGRTQTAAVGDMVAKDLDLKWPVSKVDSWISYIAGLDRDQPIHCCVDPKSKSNILIAPAGKRSYVIVIAEMV